MSLLLRSPGGPVGSGRSPMFSQYNQYEDAGPVDPDLFPATVTVADHLPVQLEDEFAFGLELIIDGLAQKAKQLAQEAARHP